MGITAFSSASSFGSIVNSILPAAAGLGLSQKKESMERIATRLGEK